MKEHWILLLNMYGVLKEMEVVAYLGEETQGMLMNIEEYFAKCGVYIAYSDNVGWGLFPLQKSVRGMPEPRINEKLIGREH